MDEESGTTRIPVVVLDEWFRPDRLRSPTQIGMVVRFLREGEIPWKRFGEIAQEWNVSLDTVETAVRALVRARMVRFRIEGRRRLYEINLDWTPTTQETEP